ncbi:MAG: glycosyltransferase family 2 protein [Candidatus Micrarchaeota archaeon]
MFVIASPQQGEKAPFISICVPTFNRKGLLIKMLGTLEREIAGFESEIEVCISDNGSKDGTQKYLEENWTKKPYRTTIYLSPTNQGVDRNLMRLVDIAKGRYIWYMGDDDEFLEGGFAKVFKFLKENDPEILYVPYISLTTEGKVRTMEEDADFFFSDLVMRPHTFINSTIMKRELFHRFERKLVDKGLETIHVHSWVMRLNGLYYPDRTKLMIFDKPAILNGGSNTSPPLSWELIVHSKCFIVTYRNLFFLPKVKLGYRLKFAFRYFNYFARAYFFILCERAFREKNEKLDFGFFIREFGFHGVFLFIYRRVLLIMPKSALRNFLKGLMWFLKKAGMVKLNNYQFIKNFWGVPIGTSTERWNEFLHKEV